MATTYHTQIQELYVAYFNRPADPAGRDFWETVLEGNGGDLAPISAAFAASAEYKDEYDQLTVSGVVTQVYQNLFGRAPDASGLAFWVNALNTRAMTVDTMVTFIAKGAQGSDKVAFDSKVVVASAFTNALNTPEEVAGYNVESLAAAKELIAGIKTAAQATAAIVPATLDASVAAVIKSGVEFTLENGLAALGNAQADLADFLEEFDTDVDGDTDVDADDVEAAVEEADDAIAALVADPLYGTSTNAGVKAALLAEQIEINAEALEDAQDALADEQEALDEVDGLGDALAALTSATEAAEEAADAEIEAEAAFAAAETSFEIRNATAVTAGTLAGGDLEIENADGDVILTMEDGEVVLGEDVDAADYPGLAAYIAAANAYLSAQADTAAADEAALFAQLQVELLDQSGVLAGAFTFTETTPEDADAPTFDEVVDELSALTAEALSARAASDAAPADVALDAAADAAEQAVTDFRGEITAYLAANDTDLADAVTAAEGVVEAAQGDIDDLAEAVEDLEAAEALADQVAALEAAVADAQEAFTVNDYALPKLLGASAFGTSGSDIFVANGVNSTITSFGRAGDDVLYIGEGFKLNTTGDLTKGDNAALEVFFVQSGNNTVVTIETKAFGSNSADAEIKITLTGVDADDLTFDNGIISL
ncbi:DUF4214 domain-containing protein [Massilia sp. ST3]|uniref:DUF4214 domain-containing protein n=1 Tax=Massilia sp. ST3 TaxID=2824903 RepID=UPI001B834231|nr:DUF4214 domain-containing protein [Massilia sp. ST3]MBQ5947640.1 DUF4214 domain-containing protein [Massilia sp. ST3]